MGIKTILFLALYLKSISEHCNYHLTCTIWLFLFFSREGWQEVRKRLVCKVMGNKNSYSLGCIWSPVTLISYIPYIPVLISKWEGRLDSCVFLFLLTFWIVRESSVSSQSYCTHHNMSATATQNTLHSGRKRCKDKILGLKSIQDSLLHIPTVSLTSK